MASKAMRWTGRIVAGLAAVILLAIALAFAVVVSRVAPHGVVPLLLAYSPGGLAEMSMVALSLALEPAFVIVHHLTRVVLVLIGAPLAFRRPQPPETPWTERACP